jgi:RNA-binding protein
MNGTKMKLKGKHVRFLRGLGHHLQPFVMIGKEELSSQVVAASNEALDTHELIKVKLQDGCIMDRKDVATELASATKSEIVQILGKTILLYRQAEKPIIELPKK